VRRGITPTRQAAQAAIAAGQVTVRGAPAIKAAHLVARDEPIVLLGPANRFVGRGGAKLDAALDRFGIDVQGMRCLDAGASTGGFTDCLLQRGASGVVALDVGYGQLHERLRADPRVDVRERTNVRSVTAADLGGPVDSVVADLSFISLRTVMPALVGVTKASAPLVLLVKPQFEAGRQEAARGQGVVRDPAVWRRALEGVVGALDDAGASIMGAMASPLTGADGNVEFLLHALAPPPRHDAAPRLSLDSAIAEGRALIARTP
jgi:23S rRNA (cytidine1920-2'-O)/16S rRNA (cytidine1409-2'-O)-methyltransferase